MVRWVITGTQPPRPQFGGLLHHVIEAGMLQRREDIVDIGRQPDIGDVALAAQRHRFLRPASARWASHSPSRPLKTADRIAAGKPQHAGQVVAPARG